MKLIRLILCLFLNALFTSSLLAQSVSASLSSSQGDFTSEALAPDHLKRTFQYSSSSLSLGNTSVSTGLASAFSYDRIFAAILEQSSNSGLNLSVYDTKGTLLSKMNLASLVPDESLALWFWGNDKIVIRHNIVRFEIYRTDGTFLASINNSSGSEKGEVMSDCIPNANGTFMVLTNPKIMYDQESGFGLSVVENGDFTRTSLLSERGKELSYAHISNEGIITAVAVHSSQSSSTATILDASGTIISTLDIELPLLGIQLADGTDRMAAYSDGRAQIYNTQTKERLLSSSVRGKPLLFAAYSRKDLQLVMVSGDFRNNQLSNIEVQVVHATQKKLASTEVAGNLEIRNTKQLSLKRIGANQFKIVGGNQPIRIRTRF